MGSFDPELRLPLPDDLPAEAVAALCDVLRDLADAVENRYADRLVAHRRQCERDASPEGRADENRPGLHPDDPPF